MVYISVAYCNLWLHKATFVLTMVQSLLVVTMQSSAPWLVTGHVDTSWKAAGDRDRSSAMWEAAGPAGSG